MKKFLLTSAKIAILIIAIFLIGAFSNSYFRSFLKVALVMPEFIAQNNYAGWKGIFKVSLLPIVTKTPSVKTVAIKTPAGDSFLADLWLPKDTKKQYGAAITTLGIRVDRKDSRATFLADKIARLGVAVLVPEIPGFLAGRTSLDQSEYLVAAFEYLEAQPFIKKDKIGFLAFCGTSVIATIAAENPKIANKAAYLFVNNLFYNSDTLYQAIVLGQLTDNKGAKTFWNAHHKTIGVFNREFIEALPNDFDREILTTYLINQPENVIKTREFPPIPATTFAKLSTDGKKVYQLLVNKDASLTQTLLSQQPESVNLKVRSQNTAIPKIDNLKAHLFIIVDRGSTFLPFTDAHKVVSHLPKGQYTFVETDLLRDSLLIQDLSLAKALTQGVKILILTTSLLVTAS